jgi:hypothetical protein
LLFLGAIRVRDFQYRDSAAADCDVSFVDHQEDGRVMSPATLANTVSIAVFEDAAQPPTKTFTGIPWFPGMTILQAMILAQAMNVGGFEFQVEYNSIYGAFVNKIDSVEDHGSSVLDNLAQALAFPLSCRHAWNTNALMANDLRHIPNRGSRGTSIRATAMTSIKLSSSGSEKAIMGLCLQQC